MDFRVKRLEVYQYLKSKKIFAACPNRKLGKFILLDLSPDLRELTKIRTSKYIRSDTSEKTNFKIEVEDYSKPVGIDDYLFEFKLIRVVTNEDLDLERWKTTKTLSELPICPHPHIFEEEKIWAGKREGNIVEGVVLSIFTIAAWWFLYLSVTNKTHYIIAGLAVIILTGSMIIFKWRLPKKPDNEKLVQLIDYKNQLITNEKLKRKQSQTRFENFLNEYSNWERSSPKQFEKAIKTYLKKSGYELQVTQYIGDGGIDLEGKNADGDLIIIQAKKYTSNVGVSVVREMIGVRESHPDKPLSMIVSLVGFTRGAAQLARKEGVILKSIKKDLIGI